VYESLYIHLGGTHPSRSHYVVRPDTA